MTEPAPNNNPTQLLRYQLQIAALNDAESIAQVRQVLTGLGLVVDRIEADEAEVAVATATNPGPEGIQAALESAGYSVQNITAVSS